MKDFEITTAVPTDFAFVELASSVEDMPKTMADGFKRLATAFGKARISFGGPPLAHYLSYDATSSTFQLGFPVQHDNIDALRKAGLEIGHTSDGKVMKAMHIGPYATLMQTYEVMRRKMAEGLSRSRGNGTLGWRSAPIPAFVYV